MHSILVGALGVNAVENITNNNSTLIILKWSEFKYGTPFHTYRHMCISDIEMSGSTCDTCL